MTFQSRTRQNICTETVAVVGSLIGDDQIYNVIVTAPWSTVMDYTTE